MIAAFESLRVRVETDQQEMQKGIYIYISSCRYYAKMLCLLLNKMP